MRLPGFIKDKPMPHFFVIDQKRNMHLIEAKDKASASEKHNDFSEVRADICIEAISCCHPNKFIGPELPDWMEYYPSASSKICSRCSTPKEPENQLPSEPYYYN